MLCFYAGSTKPRWTHPPLTHVLFTATEVSIQNDLVHHEFYAISSGLSATGGMLEAHFFPNVARYAQSVTTGRDFAKLRISHLRVQSLAKIPLTSCLYAHEPTSKTAGWGGWTLIPSAQGALQSDWSRGASRAHNLDQIFNIFLGQNDSTFHS